MIFPLFQFDRDSTERAGELERRLVFFGYRRAGVKADVERFVERNTVGDAPFDTSLADLPSIGMPFQRNDGAELYHAFTYAHVINQLQLLLFSGLAFFLMLPYLKRTLTVTLDVDWVWRRLLPGVWGGLEAIHHGVRRVADSMAGTVGRALFAAVNRHAGAEARLARTWTVRRMALSVLVVLLGYLMLYYL
jgi:hypothetical protein